MKHERVEKEEKVEVVEEYRTSFEVLGVKLKKFLKKDWN
jgi:hypothetical protein